MGWIAISDSETDEECGIVGDEAFDLAGTAIEKLRTGIEALYMREFGRSVTDIEFEHIINFVNLPKESK